MLQLHNRNFIILKFQFPLGKRNRSKTIRIESVQSAFWYLMFLLIMHENHSCYFCFIKGVFMIVWIEGDKTLIFIAWKFYIWISVTAVRFTKHCTVWAILDNRSFKARKCRVTKNFDKLMVTHRQHVLNNFIFERKHRKKFWGLENIIACQ